MSSIKEHYFFSGDEEMNTTLANVAASDQSSNYDSSALGGLYRDGVVRIGATDHGFKAPVDTDRPNLIYLQGTTNYDGLRYIVAVATDTFDIIAPFVAETPNAKIARPGLSFDERWEFVGFKLHLAAACATAEDFEIHVDADRGAGWDYKIFDEDMNGVSDRSEKYAPGEIILQPNDIVYATFANTNDNLWGLEFIARRMA